MKKFFRSHFWVFLILTAILAFDFGKFSMLVSKTGDAANINKVDAIITFTGGSDRIKTAVNLLEQGYAGKLFISGVNKNVSLDEVLKQIDKPDTKIYNKIEVGYEATNTKENAKETASWVLSHNFNKIILVTSSYHMPRSYLELKEVMPQITIYEYPVFSENMNRNKWWTWSGATTLVIMEYLKFTAVKIKYFLFK
ncbi:MAG: YdcF family protein [Alphaproteobacteria bacterium]